MNDVQAATAPVADADFRVRVPAKDLRRALTLAAMVAAKARKPSRLAPRRGAWRSRKRGGYEPIPATTCVKITVDDGILRIYATDLDIEIVQTLAVESRGGGSMMVPLGELARVVAVVPAGEAIEIETPKTANRIEVKTARSTWNFKCDVAEVSHYPEMPIAELPITLAVGADVMRLLLDHALYAVSREETRFYLNGVHFSRQQNNADPARWRAAATDGHRLAIIEEAAPSISVPPFILPTKAAALLRAAIKSNTGGLLVGVSTNGLHLSVIAPDGILIRAKLIDGTFPDIDRVIPKGSMSKAAISGSAVTAAVHRVCALAGRKEVCAVQFSFTADQVEISLDIAGARSSETIPCEFRPPPIAAPFVVGINHTYIIDAMKRIAGDADISFTDASSPMVIRDPAVEGAFSVLMPMRIE